MEPQGAEKLTNIPETKSAAEPNTVQVSGTADKAKIAVKPCVMAAPDDFETESEPYTTEDETENLGGTEAASGALGARSEVGPVGTVAADRSNELSMKVDEWLAQTDADRHAQEGAPLLEPKLSVFVQPERPNFNAVPMSIQFILDDAVCRAAATLEKVKVDGVELARRSDMWVIGLAMVELICTVRNDNDAVFTTASWKREIARGWAMATLHAKKASTLQEQCDKLKTAVEEGHVREERLTQQLKLAMERADKARAILTPL
ncbi:hypothetical protein V8E36_008093 [Tilletia maclaganii]